MNPVDVKGHCAVSEKKYFPALEATELTEKITFEFPKLCDNFQEFQEHEMCHTRLMLKVSWLDAEKKVKDLTGWFVVLIIRQRNKESSVSLSTKNTLFPGFKELESLSFSVMVAFGDSSPVLLREKRRDSGMLKNIEELCNPEGDLQVQIELSTLHLSEKPEAPSTKPRENLHLLEHLTDPEFCERLPVGK